MTNAERTLAIAMYVSRRVALDDEQLRRDEWEAGQRAKSYAGASVAMMRRRHVAARANEVASRAVLWCDLHRLAYASVDAAVDHYLGVRRHV